jgi:succinate dehydrogenase / fumarate reductase, membrane anchor subunit
MERRRMRSPLGLARGLGSAKEGVEPWWLERVTAVALVPLTLWLAAALIARTGSDYTSFVMWLRAPLHALLMTLLLIALFSHLALGLRVVIEDYLHSAAKIPALLAVHFSCLALGDRHPGHTAYRFRRLNASFCRSQVARCENRG